MNNAARKQFLELVHQFKLTTEANKEAMASALLQQNNQEAAHRKVLTPVLAFCMEKVSNPGRAEAMFEHVLRSSGMVYWPNPKVTETLRQNSLLKGLCYKHCIVPVQFDGLSLTLCGTNKSDVDAMLEIISHVKAEDDNTPYTVFCVSEPNKIIPALNAW